MTLEIDDSRSRDRGIGGEYGQGGKNELGQPSQKAPPEAGRRRAGTPCQEIRSKKERGQVNEKVSGKVVADRKKC
jgi:hypothetical protein